MRMVAKAETGLQCTYCKGTEFYEGPAGGVSVNVLCAEESCRHWFNYTPFGMEDLNRVEPVEPTEQERLAAEVKLAVEWRTHEQKMFAEGAGHYLTGLTAGELLQKYRREAYGYGESRNNVLRLAGWIDEFVKDAKQRV